MIPPSECMKKCLQQLGVVLVLFGMVSALGEFSDPNFVRILGWMNTLGETDTWREINGWFLRIGVIVAGVGFLLVARRQDCAEG